MLHVQNWKVQSRQTWRKKSGEVMTRIRAETPKKRERERERARESEMGGGERRGDEMRGEKTEKYPYNSDLKGIS
jgi:hypothetical protein